MADYIVDMKDIQFVLFEQLRAQDKILKFPRYSSFSKDDMVMLLEEAKKLAVEKIAPTNPIGDKKGCKFDKGDVKVPEEFHEIYKLYCEAGWVGAHASPEFGGQGLPGFLAPAVGDIFIGAGCAFSTYVGLTSAGSRLIETFGTDQMKKTYVPPMAAGKWTGTMLLTEPQAGSAVGDITTIGKKEGDHFLLTGTKSFITAGEHDLSENIVHLVLSRTEGAPKGIKGLSLFIVPKFIPNPDGSIGKRNDIVCSRIEEKMGIHGSSTCLMTMGDNGKCVGYLIGEEGKGIQIMFHLMNEARIGVGVQSLAQASAAYQYALQYSKERIQGTEFHKLRDVDAERVAIIRHPDVKMMLATMKAYVEGMRALLYACAYYGDIADSTSDADEKAKYFGFMDLLTPICKAYCSDMAFQVACTALQVYGGYGYTAEYPVEQLVRDLKVNSIYEGTNGIQALDLLGRKVSSKGGLLFMNYINEINTFVEANKSHPTLAPLVEAFDKAKTSLTEVTMHLGGLSMGGDQAYPVLNATPYLEMFGDVVCAYYLLDQAVIASKKVSEGNYYKEKVQTAEFFIKNLLPRVLWRAQSIVSGSRVPLEMTFEQ